MKTKHFVSFFSPGTFVSETSDREVSSWDVNEAVRLSKSITERHGAKPYGFRFKTVKLVDDGWNKETSATSGMYYLGGKVLSLQNVIDRNDPKNSILISNMKNNDYPYVIENTNSYKITLPFDPNTDKVL